MATKPVSDAARARAVKRHVWAERHPFTATCALGLEDLLTRAVARLAGASDVTARPGGVRFTAPFDTIYTALLTLRVAESLRVDLLADAAAVTFPMLHDNLTRVRWWLWLPDRAELTVRVSSAKSRLRDDAGLERTLRRVLQAQGIETTAEGAPAMTLRLGLYHDRAHVSLDLGGALHRRSGDRWVTTTTIRETTAAALAELARVADHDLVVDPFCGSGTLIGEAIELAHGTVPGRRLRFAFEASPAWKSTRFAHARRTTGADEPVAPAEPQSAFVARDADPEALRVARRNFTAAGLDAVVEVAVARAQDLDLADLARRHGARRPLLLTNPPYGRSAHAIGGTADDLVRGVLASARGWDVAVLYPRPDELAKVPGLEVRHVRKLVTGGLRNAILLGRLDA